MQIKRGEVWYIEKGYSVGSEQNSGRPAVIVSNDKNNTYSTTVEVVYFTTQSKRDLTTHVLIHSLSRISTALCEQITTVSTDRVGNYCGTVTGDEMDAIESAICISLGIRPEGEQLSPPALASRLAKVETECGLLRQMYDSLLNKFIKVS